MTCLSPSHQWIIGICSVIFDIDVGQRIEHLVPAACLSKEEQQDVAFHSFPDSMSMELHARTSIKDSTFFFRVRRRGLPALLPQPGGPPQAASCSGQDVASPGVDSSGSAQNGDKHPGKPSDERFIYGFVFCRQRQDASLRRGGEQLSVVVLAEHPLSAALQPLAAVAGHAFFGAPGGAALRQVYDEVCRWPAPVAGPPLQLPVSFTSLSARLPAWETLPHPSAVTAQEQYGNNLAPSMRTSSSARSLPPASASSSRRQLMALEERRSASGPAPAPSPLRNGSAGGLAQAGSPRGEPSSSPFSSATGQLGQLQIALAPSQQLLQRQPSSPPASPRAPPAASSDPAMQPTGSSMGSPLHSGALAGPSAAAAAASAPQPGTAASRDGGLAQISGLLAAAEGCSPATAPLPPLAAPQGQHTRNRSYVQVPSRTASHAGAADELPGAYNGGLRQGQGHAAEGQGLDDAGEGSTGLRVLQIHRRASSNLPLANSDGSAIHGAFHEMDVFTPLSGHLSRLWALWEMTLLGRALMLVAPSPGETAAGVAALLALTAPLPYAPDFRPYYCIHDTAFSRMAAGQLPGPEARDVPTLIGVTNLYFVRALPHWPNVLSIGKRDGAPAAVQQAAGSLAAAATMFGANAAVQALRQRTQGATVLLSGHTEALWASYKPLCRPDQALLAKLLAPKAGDVKSKVARIAFVNSDTIRRHFAELTAAFLSPFGRYFEPDAEGRVPGWNSEEFLFGLRSGEVTLPQQLMDRVGSPAAAVELYARFVSCLNFAAWFAARRRHLAHLIAPRPHPHAHVQPHGVGVDREGGQGRNGDGAEGMTGVGVEEGEEGGISSWFHSAAQHLDEVKVIGMYFSVEQQLMEALAEAASPDAPDEAHASVSRLQRELALLFFGGAMPEELQLTCVSSPARRELLAALPLSAAQEARVHQLIDMLQGGDR